MYLKFTSLALIASLIASALAAPASESLPVDKCGQATADRKAYLTSLKANAQDLAITIQETGCAMNSKYAYGDNKVEDSANFGLFKNNWYTIRTYCSEFSGKGYGPKDYKKGDSLNGDDAAAIRCQHDAMGALKGDFWARQRGGQTPGGCSADPTGEIYQKAIGQITNFINQNHMKDDAVIHPQVTAC